MHGMVDGDGGDGEEEVAPLLLVMAGFSSSLPPDHPFFFLVSFSQQRRQDVVLVPSLHIPCPWCEWRSNPALRYKGWSSSAQHYACCRLNPFLLFPLFSRRLVGSGGALAGHVVPGGHLRVD